MITSLNHRSSHQMAARGNLPIVQMGDSRLIILSNKKLENINCIFRSSETLGGLYLGDIVSTLKEEHLKNHNIRAILTCMWEKTSINPIVNSHKILPIKDLPQYPIIQHFDDAVNWITEKRKEKHNVLVHCHAGISRSATIVIAYLIRSQNWNPFQALEFVKQQRDRVKPNAGFWNQINEYYNYWSKQNLSQIIQQLEISKIPQISTVLQASNKIIKDKQVKEIQKYSISCKRMQLSQQNIEYDSNEKQKSKNQTQNCIRWQQAQDSQILAHTQQSSIIVGKNSSIQGRFQDNYQIRQKKSSFNLNYSNFRMENISRQSTKHIRPFLSPIARPYFHSP